MEFGSFEKALATYNSAAYQAALKALGSAAERDFRIVEGVDSFPMPEPSSSEVWEEHTAHEFRRDRILFHAYRRNAMDVTWSSADEQICRDSFGPS